jgi:hypothetical protein
VERREAGALIAKRAHAKQAGLRKFAQACLHGVKFEMDASFGAPLPHFGEGNKKTGVPISGLPEIGYPHLPDRLKPIGLRRPKNTGCGAMRIARRAQVRARRGKLAV